MRETLLHVPHEGWFGLQLFGVGWLLIIWLLVSATWLAYLIRIQGWNNDTISYIPVILVVAGVVFFVLPMLEKRDPITEVILGIPIRGYGTFVAMGCVLGVGMVTYRASKLGIDPDMIYTLAFVMFVGAILGARAFFVLQYWHEFQGDTTAQTIWQVISFTEGGLVVYGALLGGVPAGIWYLRKEKQHLLAIGDLVAPSLLAGLAIGRIGCLMNGCCYGGIVVGDDWGLRFPPGSPPYMRQIESGELLGMKLERRRDEDGRRTVITVAKESLAAAEDVKKGDRIVLQSESASVIKATRHRPDDATPLVTMKLPNGNVVGWRISQLPASSLPVQPTQLFSSINAALLSAVLWFAFPFRNRNGQIFALLLILYPITRFLLEIIRTDETGALGTSLTISQLVSLVLITAAIGLWVLVQRSPRLGNGGDSSPAVEKS